MSRLLRRLWFVALLPWICLGCTPDNSKTGTAPVTEVSKQGEPARRRVRLLLNWLPEAEHGGFYAAQLHGYYRQAGLDVEILPGGPNAPVVQQVATQQLEFGVVNADLICFGRAQEAPVKALMAPLQVSPRCLIVHEKSGIRSFADIKNMTVAMSTSNAFSHFLRKKFPFTDVQIEAYSGNVAKFLIDQNFAQQGYVFSEPFLIQQQGGDPHVLMVSDVGFNPYTSCLIAHDLTIKNDSELVRGMVEATVKGWEQYLKSPAETNAAIHALNPDMSLDVLKFGVESLRPLVEDEVAKTSGLGHMSRERWQTLVDQLVEVEQLPADKVQVDELFTTQFLPSRSPAASPSAPAEQPAEK